MRAGKGKHILTGVLIYVAFPAEGGANGGLAGGALGRSGKSDWEMLWESVLFCFRCIHDSWALVL